MNGNEANSPFDTVLKWDTLKIQSDRIIRQRYLVALLVTAIAGLGLVSGLITGPDPTSRRLGTALLMIGAGLGWSYMLRSRSAPSRDTQERLSATVKPAVAFGISIPPTAEAFLECIQSLTSTEWRTVIEAARGSWALEPPINSSLNLVPILLQHHAWRSSPELRNASEERLAFLINVVATDHQKQEWSNEARRLLDSLVDQGVLPFMPPYDEYRLALNALNAIVFAEHLPEVCREALEPFKSVLTTEFLRSACLGD